MSMRGLTRTGDLTRTGRSRQDSPVPVISPVPVRRRARLTATLVVAAAAVLVPCSPAFALPPGGADPDTPGTSAYVSPTVLAPCDTIGFTVSGFPAGEVVNVKIDDGQGYSDTTVQGSGVIAQAAIGSDGVASGYLMIPCDITPGAHWLRFLASEEIYENGVYRGVIGYTRRGGADFTVVAPSAGGGGSSSSGLGQLAPSAGTTVGEGAEQVGGQGGVLVIAPEDTPTPSPTPTASPSASATPTAVATAPPTSAPEAAADGAESGGLPIVGLVGGGAVLLTGAVAAALLLRRRGTAPPQP